MDLDPGLDLDPDPGDLQQAALARRGGGGAGRGGPAPPGGAPGPDLEDGLLAPESGLGLDEQVIAAVAAGEGGPGQGRPLAPEPDEGGPSQDSSLAGGGPDGLLGPQPPAAPGLCIPDTLQLVCGTTPGTYNVKARMVGDAQGAGAGGGGRSATEPE